MRRLKTTQFAIHFSVWSHAALVIVLAWQSMALFQPVDFAGQRQAVTVSATFAPPIVLSEPEPVELVQSEMHATESTVDVQPDDTVAKESLRIEPTRQTAELLIEVETATPNVQVTERRQFKLQPKKAELLARRLPRHSRPVPMATTAMSVPVPVGTSLETPPDFSMNAPPTYPVEAVRNGWEGEVLLRIAVAPDGHVSHVSVEKSSGYEILDQAALRAVRLWKGIPATQAGEPVAVVRLMPVRFLR
ncbi:transport protein TonB [Bremerella volcania]|uniref:Transport protein TonB n=1 Tax=Bremerella volcania TaxID=2527984 RepID=A0A518C2L5_9BACT|nr:energy transducer TonB [Bremerella volcania]QDU73469.1 transport protein TonB [Bremerella volcania]